MNEQEIKIDAIEKESRAFACPCCGERLKFVTSVHINGVRKESEWRAGDEMPSTPPKKAIFTDEELAYLAHNKETGAFTAFEKAVELSNCTKPNNLERAFINLPKVLTRYKKAPQAALQILLPAEERGKAGLLELWKCGYVEVICRDGEVVAFLPVGMTITGEASGKINFTGKQESMPVETWVKTRFGYVAGKGLLFNELRQKSYGAFALSDL